MTPTVSIPSAPPHPLDCAVARAYKARCKVKGLAHDHLHDLGQALADGKTDQVIDEKIWQTFASQNRTEQADDFVWLYWYIWWEFTRVVPKIFFTGSLIDYLDPRLQGKARLRAAVDIFDKRYATQLGLDGDRAIVNGRVIYPHVEQQFDVELQQLVNQCGLYDEDRLVGYIMGTGQRYPHIPEEIASLFTNPGTAYHLADQVEALNPGMVTNYPGFDLDID